MFLLLFAWVFTARAQEHGRGFIRIDPEYPQTFKYDNGERYFPMGDTAYFLLGQSKKNIRRYIDSRRERKFNFIRVGAVGEGHWPFGGTPGRPDFTSIDEKAMRKLDWLFDHAARKGMNIELILWTYGAEGGNGMWGNPEYENRWVDTLVNRYKDRENLFMYTVANEFERYPDGAYSYEESDVDWAKRIAGRIRSIDPVHRIGAHPSHWISRAPPRHSFHSYRGFRQRYPQIVWPLWDNSDIDVLNVQNNQGVQKTHWGRCPGSRKGCAVYEAIEWEGVEYPARWTGKGWELEGPGMEDSIAEDRTDGKKPVINTEFGYQHERGAEHGNPVFATRQTHTPRTVRIKAWKISTAGGYFAAGFAHTAVGFKPAGIKVWRPAQMEILYEFFTRRTRYWKMDPCLELVDTYNSCLALAGVEYVAYFPRGGANRIHLQKGEYQVEWLDPEKGIYYPGGVAGASGGWHSFTPPKDPSSDWVLHLNRQTGAGSSDGR